MKSYYAGDSFKIEYTVTGSDGAALDLTGKSLRWGMKLRNSDDAGITKTLSDDGLTVVDETAGRVDADVLKGEIQTPGRYTVELEVSDGTWSKTAHRAVLTLKDVVFSD